MSSTISTSRPSIGASRSLRMRTTPGGVGLRAVAGDRHEVDLAGDVEVAHQVGEEEHGALEHADHDQLAAGVVAADLRAQLGDAPLQVLSGDEGLADRGVDHGAQSRYRGRSRHALGAEDAALDDGADAAAEVERVEPLRRRPATWSAKRAAPATGRPAASSARRWRTSRRSAGCSSAKRCERDRAPRRAVAVQLGVDQGVEHLGLVAQQRRRAQHVLRRRRVDPLQLRAAGRGGRGCARSRPPRCWRRRARPARAPRSRRWSRRGWRRAAAAPGGRRAGASPAAPGGWARRRAGRGSSRPGRRRCGRWRSSSSSRSASRAAAA